MNVTINSSVLQKYNLSIKEFLVLYLCFLETDIEKTINSLVDKKIADKNLYNNIDLILSDNTKELIATILVESDKAVVNNQEKFNQLAEKMRDLYPAGKKPGTTYYWKDSVPIIARKLETLVSKFNVNFTEEEVLNATKRYIDSFNGDYRYMQLLKYFILKTDRTTGEVRSELLAFLANEDEEDSADWTTNLV